MPRFPTQCFWDRMPSPGPWDQPETVWAPPPVYPTHPQQAKSALLHGCQALALGSSSRFMAVCRVPTTGHVATSAGQSGCWWGGTAARVWAVGMGSESLRLG